MIKSQNFRLLFCLELHATMSTSKEAPVLADRSKDPENPPEIPGQAPSKSALKKAAKEKEKAEKAAKRAAQEQQAKAAADANDTAKHLYGPLPTSPEPSEIVALSGLNEKHFDQQVTIQTRVHNARVQSAKLAFLVLREQTETIQVVVAEGGGDSISRQMVKFAGGINAESIVRVTGLVKKPKEPVKSTTLSELEMHVEKIYLVSEGLPMLPMQIKDAMRPPPEAGEVAEEGAVDAEGVPVVSLNTRLNNRVLDLRTPTNQAIFKISSGVKRLFFEYMWDHGFTQIETPKLMGAATEGGSGVFTVDYFQKKAFLAQSPQLHKQMCIAGDMKRVFEASPVFRAENSNTHRHLTEVS